MWKGFAFEALAGALAFFPAISSISSISWAATSGAATSGAATPAPSSTPASDDGRVLDGHYFIRNGVTTFPFTAPYINMSLQGALASLNEAGASQPIKAAGISPSVIGQFRPFELVSFEIGAQFSEIFGADSYSAYVQGAALTYGFTSAVKVEAAREDDWAITPELFYSFNKTMGFSPLSAINNNITSPTQANASSLLAQSLDHEIRPGVLFAYTPDPAVGISGELGVGFDESNSSGPTVETELARVGLAADVNLASTSGIPLGLALFFSDESPLNASASNTEILGGGVYEMINGNFNFGAEVSELLGANSSMQFLLSLTAYY